MIRPVDMAYVSRLKNVISNNLDHEKMTEPPMAVAPVEKVDFQLGNKVVQAAKWWEVCID